MKTFEKKLQRVLDEKSRSDTMGLYVIQGILGDRVQFEEHKDTKTEAVLLAKQIARDPTTEATSIRIITIDGDYIDTIPVK
jgi:hypothetical protein